MVLNRGRGRRNFLGRGIIVSARLGAVIAVVAIVVVIFFLFGLAILLKIVILLRDVI